MALLWLADELRKAGLTVEEYPGWKTHYRSGSWNPTFGVVHATAAPKTQTDTVQTSVVRNGRSDLPGPIANAVIKRNGVWVVTSSGRCNSTLEGTAGPFKGKGNANALSTEGCNDNKTEPWSAVQYQSYVRGWSAWCKRLGWPASRLVGHKEHTPGRKSDPTFSMSKFRTDVLDAGTGGFNHGGLGLMFCKLNEESEAVKYLQYRLYNLGFYTGTVDSDYGPKTAAALSAAVKSFNGSANDGKSYDANEMIYVDVMWSQKYGGKGQPGPQGPQGPIGPVGPQGPIATVNYEQLTLSILSKISQD